MGKKETLIIHIRLTRFKDYQSKGLSKWEAKEKALETTKGYFSKSVKELQSIWNREYSELKEKGLV